MVFTVTALAEGDTLATTFSLFSSSCSKTTKKNLSQVFMYETHAAGAISTL